MTPTVPVTRRAPSAVTPIAGLAVLARIEARRFARHPLFLTGTVLLMVTTASTHTDEADVLAFPVMPALFLGVLGLVVAAQLTRSMQASGGAVATTPVPATTRTAAMCLACAVPAVAAAVWVVAFFTAMAIWPPDPRAWWLETMPTLDVVAIVVDAAIVAAYGGAVLGVVVSRWLGSRGAAPVSAVLLVAVVFVANGPGWASPTPWRLWHSGTNPNGSADLYPGSPLWYGVYHIVLCCLAVTAALLRDARRRRPLLMVGVALAVLAAVTCALAITTGSQHARTSPVITGSTS